MTTNEKNISTQLVDRRTVLRWAGIGVAGGALGFFGYKRIFGNDTLVVRRSFPELVNGPFVQPKELRSANGALAVTLTAAAAMVPWGDSTRYAIAYNAMVPGPTLRVRPGDKVTITLRNELDRPTNLHTHGLHVSPNGKSDNIFTMVEPGGEFTYEYEIPSDHVSGTFWYHPHHHGVAASQLSGGLAGVLIVEDAIDDVKLLPSTVERILVLSDPKIGTSSVVLSATQSEQMDGREGDEVLVNGVVRPSITAQVGTVERWRIVNASASRYYELSLSREVMYMIASDQGRLAEPIKMSSILLTPGQRAEVVVPIESVGDIVLSTAAVNRGMGGMGHMGGGNSSTLSPAADLLRVQVSKASSTSPGSVALPSALRSTSGTDGLVVDKVRRVSFGAMGMGSSEFVIDGKPFSADRIDIAAKFGSVEDWIVTNNSMMPHPFHLHVWPFQVMERSDGSTPDPGLRDVVNIPVGQSVRIRIPFMNYAGKTVYHCHILDHEDLGMMGVINVE